MSHASSQARRSRLSRSTALVATLGVAAALTATAITPAVAADAPEGDAPTDPRVVLEENFDDNTLPAGFNAVSGDWKVEGGKLVGDSQTGNLSRITFGEHLADFRMEATVRIDRSLNATRWQAFALDMPADGSTPWSQAAMRTTTTAANGLEFALRTAGNQWVVPSTASAPIDAGIGNEVKVAIEVHRGQGTWFFNGEQRMVSQQVSRFDAGIQGFVVADATVSYDDLKITELEPLPILDLREPGESATVTGHRGYSSIAPENTLPATIASRKAGADFTEVDIDFTKDNVPVIMHDDTVDRTTDGTGKIRDMMFSEFEGLDAGSWYSPEFTGTPVPTLEDLLKDLSTNGGKLLLEFKGGWPQEQAKIATDMLHEYGMDDDTIVQSFDTSTIDNIEAVAPELPSAILVSNLPANPVEFTKAHGAMALNPTLDGLKANTQAVADLHAAGLGIMVWTVDSAAQWSEATKLGVDGIITNRPGQLVGWNARYNEVPDPTTPEDPEDPEEPEVGENQQALSVVVPEAEVDPTPTGEFTWRFSTTGVVDLGEATRLGDNLSARGSLNNVLVTDTRRDPSSPWQISAQVSDFTGDAGAIPAANLGWTPRVDVEGAGAVAGNAVASGIGGTGAGLGASQVLALAPSEEYKGEDTATLGAALDLRIPLDQAAGAYSSTLTVTVVQ